MSPDKIAPADSPQNLDKPLSTPWNVFSDERPADDAILLSRAPLSESQQEKKLRMSRSEIINRMATTSGGEKNRGEEKTENPIELRIRQQLEIRKRQQEDSENEPEDNYLQNEDLQEEKLNRYRESTRNQMDSMASGLGEQLAGTIAKQAIKKGIRTILVSVIGTIISAISAIIAFLAPILLPALIIFFCLAMVYNYVSEYKISGGYQIITNQFEKLLINAANNVPPEDSTITIQD